MGNNPKKMANETPEVPHLNIYWLNVLNMSIGWFIWFSLSARNPTILEGHRGLLVEVVVEKSGYEPQKLPSREVTYPSKRKKENHLQKVPG